MAIDLFGHPDRDLPEADPGLWTEGPERNVGPPCWQGITTPCDGRCTDHVGCCDACRHSTNEICPDHCCRCVPMAICAVFTPDVDEYGDPTLQGCRTQSRKMLATPNTNGTRTEYTTSINGNDIILSVGQPEYGSPLNEYAYCTWRFQSYSLGIDEEVEVTHNKGEVNCLQLPEFYANYLEGACGGEITFEAWEMKKVPYQKRHFGETGSTDLYPGCGYCDQICTLLAVYRGTDEDYGYSDDDSCIEFEWDEYERKWSNYDTGEEILLVEEYDECYLELRNWAEETFEEDRIILNAGECTTSLVKTIRDELGNWVKIACKPCSCWKHICGTCRCVPDTICVTGEIGGYPAGGELIWDSEYLHWSDGYITISMYENDNGQCEVAGGGLEPAVVECGQDFFFTILPTDEQVAAGYTDFLSGWAKQCAGTCGGGGSCFACDDVPETLYCLVYPREWTPALGCEGSPTSNCFEPISVSLSQRFVPTALNPAGEWRWIGTQTFECRGCDTGGNPGFKEYRSTRVDIDMGCDGVGSATFTGESALGGTATEVIDFLFSVPCGDGEYWDLGPYTVDSGGLLICCNEAGFVIQISDTPESYY